VSVSIEDVKASDWAEKVYKPDIIGRPDSLYEKPDTILDSNRTPEAPSPRATVRHSVE
jgi:hypothetical protein